MTTSPLAALAVVVASVIGSFGALFLKYGANKLSRKTIKQVYRNHHLFLGVLFYGLSSVFFIVALKYGELSVLYPLTSLGYVWIALLSIKFLKEKMNFFKWMGIACILVGVSLIGLAS